MSLEVHINISVSDWDADISANTSTSERLSILAGYLRMAASRLEISNAANGFVQLVDDETDVQIGLLRYQTYGDPE